MAQEGVDWEEFSWEDNVGPENKVGRKFESRVQL